MRIRREKEKQNTDQRTLKEGCFVLKHSSVRTADMRCGKETFRKTKVDALQCLTKNLVLTTSNS